MGRLLVGGGVVVTLGDPGEVIQDGGVLLEDGTILEVGPTADLRARADEVLDAGGRLIAPGLICAHHHLYSTFACGLGFDPPSNFVQVLENLWWRLDRALDEEDVYRSALIPLARCIQAGTTTIIDHHASPSAIPGSLARIGDAVREAGIRASLCYEVTDRNGPDGAAAGIEENRAWLGACRESDGRLHGLVGVHAAMTVGPETLDRCVALAREHACGLHIHVAEDRADQEHSLETYGKRVLARLQEAGGLGSQTIAVHCIHVDDAEIELLRETDTIVVHNPQSNMNNGVGYAPVERLLGSGLRVCLGTDGMTSNMLEEARAALFIRHHADRDPAAGFLDVLDMLLQNNAAVASAFFGKKIGVLEPGAAADVIVADYVPFTEVHPMNVGGHLLFGAAAHRMWATICDGRVLLREGQLQTLDLHEIANRTRERSPATWERFASLDGGTA